MWKNLKKSLILTKLKKLNCDKTNKKPKLWQNSNSNCNKTKKNKLWQNLKDQIVTKLKNTNCAKLKKINCSNSKTQIVIVIKITVVTEEVIMTSFSKNTLTTDHLSGQLFTILAMFFARGGKKSLCQRPKP